ncbi:MAG: 6,7-dimethyl-8-ribityllumazine synthase [Bacteroidetes bacterium 47-18]|nr:MAG: 6,7-dimethyl-8-ribityllumazine synthase [Bacteroidetes bacterium 47-18]
MALSTENNTLLDISALHMPAGTKVAVIATQWNEKIVAEQVAGAARIARQAGVELADILYVPGCVELPYAIRKYLGAAAGIGAVIAFGAVVRGDTPHFDYVCNMVSEGINHLNLAMDVPVIFGVLTVNTEQQAWERLGGAHGHKGEEAMITALKMIQFEQQLSSRHS